MSKLHKYTYLASTTIFIAMVLTANPTFATSTTLNGVEISSSPNRGYEIVLNTDTETNIEKKTVNSDKLVLDLKNTKISKNADTVYKNADGIENVILKPKSKDLQIEINGKEAGKSNVSLNNEIQAVPKAYNNTVFINKPMKSYAPVHENIEEEESVATSVTLVTLAKKIIHSSSIKSLLTSSNFGWIICLMLMMGFFLSTRFNKEKHSKINVRISNNAIDKENKLLKASLNKKEKFIPDDITIPRKRTQIQPKTSPISAQKANYGLKAYNNQALANSTNSIKNQNIPYNNSLRKEYSADNLQLQPKVATVATKEAKQNVKNEIRIDNVKFLESMARIYEKSGRADLASGLANNIKKAKFTR